MTHLQLKVAEAEFSTSSEISNIALHDHPNIGTDISSGVPPRSPPLHHCFTQM